ncbi:rta1 domain [Moniliophthora roreri]|nr:rta1 domain [Moniliophthora roreri]
MSSAGSEQSEQLFVLYHYVPSLPAGILFTAIFGKFVKPKHVEAVGYFGWILSHYNNIILGPYIMQTLLILIALALIAASIYIILGRIIVAVKAE